MPRHSSTHFDAIKINAKLEKVLRKTGDGYVEYVDNNISDATVGLELKVPTASVARIRSELFGNLQSARGNMLTRLSAAIEKIEAQEAHIAAQDRRIDAIENRQEEWRIKHNKLLGQISLSRNSTLPDLKHLEIMPPPQINGSGGEVTRR
jgi:hypothetical protein